MLLNMSEQHPLSNELSFEFYNFHTCNQLSLTLFSFQQDVNVEICHWRERPS